MTDQMRPIEVQSACPFCGCDSGRGMEEKLWVSMTIDCDGFKKWCVECGNCGARGPSLVRELDAITQWNARKQP